MEPITIIGAGLAGCEAAWQIAQRGGKVILYEMKPEVYSPAHRSPFFAELVCSNSFKSESIENASGVLKEEMRQLESLILKVAQEAKVPAGDSLAVDREGFLKTDHPDLGKPGKCGSDPEGSFFYSPRWDHDYRYRSSYLGYVE